MVFNITEHVQGVQYLLRFWRSDGVLNLNTYFYNVVFDLFCIFRENTHEQQLIQAKILYQCPSRNILDFVYGGSHSSTGVIFLRVRHVKNRPLWHFFYTWDTFFYGQGSFLYDEKWPLGRFSTGVVIRRYTGLVWVKQMLWAVKVWAKMIWKKTVFLFTLVLNYDSWEMGLSYCTWVFFVTRPFTLTTFYLETFTFKFDLLCQKINLVHRFWTRRGMVIYLICVFLVTMASFEPTCYVNIKYSRLLISSSSGQRPVELMRYLFVCRLVVHL